MFHTLTTLALSLPLIHATILPSSSARNPAGAEPSTKVNYVYVTEYSTVYASAGAIPQSSKALTTSSSCSTAVVTPTAASNTTTSRGMPRPPSVSRSGRVKSRSYGMTGTAGTRPASQSLRRIVSGTAGVGVPMQSEGWQWPAVPSGYLTYGPGVPGPAPSSAKSVTPSAVAPVLSSKSKSKFDPSNLPSFKLETGGAKRSSVEPAPAPTSVKSTAIVVVPTHPPSTAIVVVPTHPPVQARGERHSSSSHSRHTPQDRPWRNKQGGNGGYWRGNFTRSFMHGTRTRSPIYGTGIRSQKPQTETRRRRHFPTPVVANKGVVGGAHNRTIERGPRSKTKHTTRPSTGPADEIEAMIPGGVSRMLPREASPAGVDTAVEHGTWESHVHARGNWIPVPALPKNQARSNWIPVPKLPKNHARSNEEEGDEEDDKENDEENDEEDDEEDESDAWIPVPEPAKGNNNAAAATAFVSPPTSNGTPEDVVDITSTIKTTMTVTMTVQPSSLLPSSSAKQTSVKPTLTPTPKPSSSVKPTTKSVATAKPKPTPAPSSSKKTKPTPEVHTSIKSADSRCPYPYPGIYCGKPKTTLVTVTAKPSST
ncbi:hypothetical protein NX059_007294 [Plenodomus lindquistii]|nr:hypothetical protein NX059_007294 [Plenodomus lindquistii]